MKKEEADRMFEAGRIQGRLECMEEINALIKTGKLDGNGCDETAQRNGLILAFNQISKNGSLLDYYERQLDG